MTCKKNKISRIVQFLRVVISTRCRNPENFICDNKKLIIQLVVICELTKCSEIFNVWK